MREYKALQKTYFGATGERPVLRQKGEKFTSALKPQDAPLFLEPTDEKDFAIWQKAHAKPEAEVVKVEEKPAINPAPVPTEPCDLTEADVDNLTYDELVAEAKVRELITENQKKATLIDAIQNDILAKGLGATKGAPAGTTETAPELPSEL